MRVAILGNSGSGKTTLARWLARQSGAAVLDLDTVAWEPNRVAALRPADAARAEVSAFCRRHPHWVVEGCYAGLVSAALEFGPHLVLLDPGVEQCLANCASRPWEPHKYASKHEQDERLAFLLGWVRDYYTRDGDLSQAGHRACFDAYPGPKTELNALPSFEPPAPALLACLA